MAFPVVAPRPSGFALPLVARSVCLLAATLALALAGGPAAAVHINVEYDHTDSPSFDPTGDKLHTLVSWAAEYYESILIDWPLPDDAPAGLTSFSIEVWWEDLDDGGGDSNGELGVTRRNPFEIDLVFDTKRFGLERNWYFDETPLDNSEFTFAENLGKTTGGFGFGQTLFRELPVSQQEPWFGGNPHDVLEVGYNAPAVVGGPADGKYDLWSTILHEMGHLLGIRSEYIDDDHDYEFHKKHHGGDYAAANEVDDGDDDDGHLAALTTLMRDGGGMLGVRQLPSATDLMAMAYQLGPVDVNLPRMDFLGHHGTSWDEPLNWIGGRVPSTFNEAFVRNGTPVVLSNSFNTARNLFVSDDSSLTTTGSSTLKVYHELRVGNRANGTSGEVHVGDLTGVPWLEVETLRIQRGFVDLASPNSVLLVHRDASLEAAGALTGAGAVEVKGMLNNDGEISAGASLLFGYGGELTLNGIEGGQLDLDGGREAVLDPNPAFVHPGQPRDELGRITAVNGDLRVISSLTDTFDGTATIGAFRTMTFMKPWGFGGSLVMRGGKLAGAKIGFGGTTTVEKGVNTISAPLVTGLFTRIIVQNGAQLNLAPEYLGSAGGTQEFAGGIQVDAGATLNVDVPGAVWRNRGGLTMALGSTVTGDNIENTGRIKGSGELAISHLDNSGTVAPAAELRLPGGVYNQSAAGRLEIDLAGFMQGGSFDVLRAGTALLDGTLAITLVDGFVPAAGSQFEFLTAGLVGGAFGNLEVHVPDEVRFDGYLSYESDKVTFHVSEARLTADFDGDGDVDGADLAGWQNTPGADGMDLLRWQRQLGRFVATPPTGPRVPGGPGNGGIGGGPIGRVPEPTSGLLAFLTAAVAATMRRHAD
jgi:hypothetical protein